jgi:TonB family protein
MILESMVLIAAAPAPPETPPVVPVTQEQIKQASVTTVADALRALRASDFPDWKPPPDKPESFPAPPAPSLPPGTWVETSDYPPEALRNDEEGTTHFVLAVSEDGKVEDCKVVTSSGHQALDDATCTLIQQRARFRPAFDKDGNKVAGTYATAVVWKIPAAPSPPPFKFVITYTVEKDGAVTGCKVIADEGQPAELIMKASPCSQVKKMVPYLDADGNPIRKQVTISIINDVADAPEP